MLEDSRAKLENIFADKEFGTHYFVDFPNDRYTQVIEHAIIKDTDKLLKLNGETDGNFKKVHHEFGYDLDFNYKDTKSKLEIKSVASNKIHEWESGKYRVKHFDNSVSMSGINRRNYQGTTIDLSSIMNYPDSVDFVLFFEHIVLHPKMFGYKLLKILTPTEVIERTTINELLPQNGNEAIASLSTI